MVASALALVATTDPGPPQYMYSFEKTIDGPLVNLTPTAPRSSFVVRARALSFGPEGAPTTHGASAQIHGQITATGVAQRGALVRVALTGAGDGGPSELHAATSVSLSQALAFGGDCTSFSDTSPCEAELLVDFERTDAGEAGGTLSVSWSIDFASTAPKRDSSEGPLELPWEVEVLPR